MIFDSHTHLNLSGFDNDRGEIIKRCLQDGVFMINIGTCYRTSLKAIEIANAYSSPNIWASIGIHPSHTFPFSNDPKEISGNGVLDGEEFDQRFYDLAKNDKVVGIGECGLDYSYLKNFDDKTKNDYLQKEKEIFRQQIIAARDLNKPLILHVREVYEEALQMIQDINPNAYGVFHFFTGSIEQAKKIIDAGFCIGLSGVITYGNNYDQMVMSLPMDKILIETDAPYAAPVPYRGVRNKPGYVKYVAEKIAILKGLSPQEVIETTFNNAVKLFRILLPRLC